MDQTRFKRTLDINGRHTAFYDIQALRQQGMGDMARLPFSIRILVENLMRHLDGRIVIKQDLANIAGWQPHYETPVEIPFHPARVLMQDFTGVPAVVDLAAMRDAMADLGGDPQKINPLVPVELVVDHSVQVDYYGSDQALNKNVQKEYERNGERYALLKWAQQSFKNFKVVPPNSGICHQVNLEHLGRVVISETIDDEPIVYPDSLVGLDSHTTMINSIGVLGWGVGGIEAEAVMLGQPYYMSIPEVIGVKMSGKLSPGVTATDLVLRVTQLLRQRKVVEKFVEFFGPGMSNLTIPDRATIANMSPEYGATMGFFPVDEKTIDYLRLTGRNDFAIAAEAVTKAMGLFYTGIETPRYTDVIELDLTTIEPSVAGPARPQDRIALKNLKNDFADILGCRPQQEAGPKTLSRYMDESGSQTTRPTTYTPISNEQYPLELNGVKTEIGDGSLVIAAITSCTNTSNPAVLMGAGLLAQKAVALGLSVPRHVKTSLAPGSKVVLKYLAAAGLLDPLKALGFHPVAFGCTTCIGNSGPLDPALEETIRANDLTVAAVLSGNRNFEARIHQHVKANFLASPMLVVAFALTGRIDIDLNVEPLGHDLSGNPVYLDQLWPENDEIEALIKTHVKQAAFKAEYGAIFDGDQFWRNLPDDTSTTYPWDPNSTYIKRPPFFEGFDLNLKKQDDIVGARVLAMLGDSVTTDHISPAGAIPADYPAGLYLSGQKVAVADFNSYGSRRGNHEVMMRGTFGNIRIKNQLVGDREGSFTKKMPGDKITFVYDAAMAYAAEKTDLIVLGGSEYGTGSSRDWAAKGSRLLGVKAVIAESFERIHRSNLVGMGVLPLVFTPGQNRSSLGLDGTETYTIRGLAHLSPRQNLNITAVKADGSTISFEVIAWLSSTIEIDYITNGGILPYVLRKLMRQ